MRFVMDGPPDSARILVVDDNPSNRLLAKETLEDEGYQVILAEGGLPGIAAFERERPDCVLLDVRMPDLDGFAVCERIRALPEGAHTPVLFLTALRDVDTFDRALRAGGDDFLTKPIRPTELVVRVQTALRVRRMDVELRDHYALLKQRNDDLVRLQLQKERLTAFVVHDLKNPVNAMDLHAQILLREGALPDRARDSATRIRVEARQLGRMILNLLDLSKADEGLLVPRRGAIDLGAVVRDVVAELQVLAESRKVALASRLDVETAHADEDLVRRALANLIENAIRHSPKDTTVSVLARRGEGAIEIRIADEGKGIPTEMRERVFEAFVQVEAGDAAITRAGRGLGLAFCRLVAEAHGGTIWIEDASPGAVFCMRVPDRSET